MESFQHHNSLFPITKNKERTENKKIKENIDMAYSNDK